MPERLNRILTLLAARSEDSIGTKHLCELAADVTDMTGAGIMLFSDDVARGSLCATGPVSSQLEELQYTLGEGPSIDAYRGGRVITEPDLVDPDFIRWQAFAAPAVEAGAKALFSYPVRIGAIRLGALNLFRDRAGSLTDDQHADALVMSDVAARSILAMQGDAVLGTIAAELEVGTNFHFVVHQAAGMVSVQLGVSVEEALVRLRAFAFGSDRAITDVARDIVERRLRLDDPTEAGEPAP